MPKADPNLQTPRARVKHLGTARAGTRDLWEIRFTSFALLPLTVGFVVIVAMLAKSDLAEARALLGTPIPAMTMIVFVLASIWHMAVGLRSVIVDYIRHQHMRELALMANLCFSTGIGFVCTYSVLRLSFLQ
ncbi:succinate dehydrogenase / fumarate reductase membrane anchor subunit [Rhodoblastus acidophilus]|uniref:succinate dehydrogenase, hydrophobic membrane anchor protein n=1 Tax=Rhodoblastus acidophilus TaxID=1074 RepID=UPI00222472F2|nr:succinate dehydrogenase, hydrophobic membrane anchor protein [Rhodoblastus acidophilus]MCW2285281.1 succinate dehydrogenase / fumarate reductase membrane anchor subunit [Rhodoblastus acidophilus]MCW2334237.1 succinate dehydrogenase / fumarate reductase membrane anchor subunit [Rhodoblastus acidophilus]